jgi:hypothetical protein
MAKLLTIDEWLEVTFGEKSRPSKKTVYRWVAKNPAMARRMGGKLYMVEGAAQPAEPPKPSADAQRIAALL